MGILTILLVITTAWFIYHFVIGYNSKQANQEKLLKKLEYGKSIGLFAMIVGLLGQMIGFFSMFSVIEELTATGEALIPHMVFGAIKVTMIVTMYGILIYLFSLILWFVTSFLIEKKLENQGSV